MAGKLIAPPTMMAAIVLNNFLNMIISSSK